MKVYLMMYKEPYEGIVGEPSGAWLSKERAEDAARFLNKTARYSSFTVVEVEVTE